MNVAKLMIRYVMVVSCLNWMSVLLSLSEDEENAHLGLSSLGEGHLRIDLKQGHIV